MKNTLLAKELRNLTEVELEAKYQALKDEMFQLRVQLVTHQKVSNPTRFSVIKKDLARILTVKNERRKK